MGMMQEERMFERLAHSGRSCPEVPQAGRRSGGWPVEGLSICSAPACDARRAVHAIGGILACQVYGTRRVEAPVMVRSFAPFVLNQSNRMPTSQPMQKCR